jgi:hypothetical protein
VRGYFDKLIREIRQDFFPSELNGLRVSNLPAKCVKSDGREAKEILPVEQNFICSLHGSIKADKNIKI